MTNDLITGIKHEISVSNILMKLGFFCRPHIQIYPISSNFKLSDIDVIGIRFDRFLNKQMILAEVKQDSQRFSDLFKLYGFKTYFGTNSDAFFVSTKFNDIFLKVSHELEIKPISFAKLKNMTTLEYLTNTEDYIIDDIKKTENYLDKIKIIMDRDSFLKFQSLWLERDPFSKFFHIQRIFSKTNQLLNKNNYYNEVTWFRSELFIYGFLTSVDMAAKCYTLDTDLIGRYIIDKFYNIGTSKEGKLKVKRGIDELTNVIKALSKDKEGLIIPEIEIIPDYMDNLILLINHIITKSLFIQKYIIINDRLQRSNFHSKDIRIDTVAENKAQLQDIKYVNDLLLRVLHNGHIEQDFHNYI